MCKSPRLHKLFGGRVTQVRIRQVAAKMLFFIELFRATGAWSRGGEKNLMAPSKRRSCGCTRFSTGMWKAAWQKSNSNYPGRDRCELNLPGWFLVLVGHRLEPRGPFEEGQIYLPGRSIALLGNNDFSSPVQLRIVRFIDFFAKDKHHHTGILLDRSGLAEIGQLRTVIAAATLRRAAQLRKRDERNPQLLGQCLQAAGDGRHFLGAVLVALGTARRHQLQVIY